MTKEQAKLIVEMVILNDYLGNVVGGGRKELTDIQIEAYNEAVDLIGSTTYREISHEVTQEFKKEHNL